MTRIANASAVVGASWTKSSYSGNQSNCVEVALGLTNTMPVRDSKRPTGPALLIPAAAWTAFVAGLKADS